MRSQSCYTLRVKKVRFSDQRLQTLEKADLPEFSEAITRAFRLRMQTIRAAPDERDFYQLRSLRYERLKGKRAHQHSMRLNDQFRLILQYEGSGSDKTIVIVEIADYHH